MLGGELKRDGSAGGVARWEITVKLTPRAGKKAEFDICVLEGKTVKVVKLKMKRA